MAFVSIHLPAPAADGPGAWVDASALGATRTITVEGNGGVFSPFVTIECSNQDTPTVAYSLATFQLANELTFEVACTWMRAVVSNYKGGGAPTVNVGGDDASGTSSLQLPVPVGNGQGAAVDVSSLPTFKTVQVGGKFGGTLLVLVSEDGGATYSQAFSFQTGSGFSTIVIAADFMRVARVGLPLVAPGQPIVWVAATEVGGGGGGGGIDVQEAAVDVVNPATVLNFSSDFAVTVGATSTTADIALAASASGLVLAIPYTVTGAEDDAGFAVALTPSQPDTNYYVWAQMGGFTFQMTLDVPVADYAVDSFTCIPGATLADSAGNTIVFFLVRFTPA